MSPASANGLPAAPRPRRVWYRRLAHVWWRYQWPVVIALGLFFLVLGYVGFHIYFSRYPVRPAGFSDLIYYAAQLIPMISGGLQHPAPWELDVARHGLPLVVGYAGLAAIVVLLSEPLQRLRLRRTRDHVVVCGLGRKGLLLSRRFRELGLAVVAIERDADNRAVERCRDEGVIVVSGDACDPPLLEAAGAGRAAYLIAVCGADGTNVDVAFAVRALVEKTRRRARSLTCAVHIADPQLRELLQARELESQDAAFRLELFSVFDSGAHAMLVEHPVLDGADAADPLVVVVGVGNFGGSLVVHAARDWLPHWRDTGRSLRIVTIDRQALARTKALAARYPLLDTVCDLRAFDMDVASAEFHAGAFIEDDYEAAGGGALVVYVCLDQDSTALAASLALLQRFRERRARIVVRLGAASGLAAFCDDTRHIGTPARLYGFPLLERTCTPGVVLGGVHDTLARAIHEEYCSQRAATAGTAAVAGGGRADGAGADGTRDGDGPAPGDRRVGNGGDDPSVLPWELLPPALIDANRHQADHIGVELAAVGCCVVPLSDWEADRFVFSADEIELLARLEHQRWMDDYLAQGWRHAPGAKDPVRKTHPALLPWEELPEAERDKDRDAARALPGFLARACLQVRRLGPVAAGADCPAASVGARRGPPQPGENA